MVDMERDHSNLRAVAGSWPLPPPAGLNPSGYAAQTGVFVHQHRPLEANAVKLFVGSKKVLLLSLDLLYVGSDLRAFLEKGLAQEFDPRELFIGASHTHAGPHIERGKEYLGTFSEEYFEAVSDGLLQFLRDLNGREDEEVEMLVGAGVHRAGISRRRIEIHNFKFSVRMGPSRLSRDARLPHTHLSFRRILDGKPIAHVWTTPMHANSFHRPQTVSPDFPGEIRQLLREQKEAKIPVLFFQGFSGDQRPRSPSQFVRPGVVRFKAFTAAEWNHWADQLWGAIKKVQLTREKVEFLEATRIPFRPSSIFLFQTTSRKSEPQEAAVHVVLFGTSARLIALPFEVSLGWAKRLSERGVRNLPIGCSDGTLGYLPTGLQRVSGGYEPRTSQRYFGIRRLRLNFVLRISKLLRQATRVGPQREQKEPR